MIELNFYRPDDLSRPNQRELEATWRDRVLGELENFWDLEAPRIGEAGAKGWRDSLDSVEPLISSQGPAASTTLNDYSEDPFTKWATSESSMSTNQLRPARTTDPGIDDDIDPFRVVLFDDVRDFLFLVHSSDSKTQLIYAFLTFLGLPFVPPDYPTSTPFQTDGFIHTELAERPEARESFWPAIPEEGRGSFEIVQGEAMDPVRRSGLTSPFEIPFTATPVVVDLLFATKQKWFITLKKSDLQHLDVEFIRNVFTQLRTEVFDTFFDLNFFAFEACQSPKLFVLLAFQVFPLLLIPVLISDSAIKLAKQLLSVQRQNLLLWDGYARIERQRGKIEAARTVYVTALSMYRGFDRVQDKIDAPLLWRAWMEMEWEEGRAMLALKILVASVVQNEEEGLDLGKHFVSI
jgi:hypothetical protein